MHIAIVIERIETWRGGAETSTVQFANHLAQLRCRVTIITTSHAQSTSAYDIVPIKAPSRLRGTKTAAFLRRAAEYLREHSFDLVHSITPFAAADVYQPRGGTVPEMLERNRAIRSAPLRRGLKAVGQGLNLKYRVIARQERTLLARTPAPWVIAISRYVADQVERHYRFDPTRIRLIFNGVDPDHTSAEQRRQDRHQVRRQFGLADDDLMLLSVAHNFKLKGIGKLIESLPVLRRNHNLGDRRIAAVIVGRDDPTPFVRLAEQQGVNDLLYFAGPTQRISAFFHAADVLVHPTFYDPCSRVVLEGLAAGLPAITTRFNGAAEVMTDGVHGYILESPRDVEAMADRLHRLADDAHRQQCAARAPAAVADLTMARHASQVAAFYREILATGYRSVSGSGRDAGGH